MQPEAGRHGTGSRKGRKSGKKGAGESKGDGGKGLGENVKPGGKGSREKKDKTQGGGKEGGEIRGDVEGRDAEGFESQQQQSIASESFGLRFCKVLVPGIRGTPLWSCMDQTTILLPRILDYSLPGSPNLPNGTQTGSPSGRLSAPEFPDPPKAPNQNT